jgi:PAP2 superfamily
VKRLGTRTSVLAQIVGLISLLVLAVPTQTAAQTESTALPSAPEPRLQEEVTLRSLPRNFLHDQGAIWTSPVHIKARDLKWLLPLGLATGAAIATDHQTLHEVVSLDPNFNNPNVTASNVMIGGFIATPVVLYGVGHMNGDEHARETGLLGAESILDGLVVEQGMKFIFWRERPSVDNQRGRFFQSSAGWDSSFPSSHAVLAWATASSIATEYPRNLVRIPLYAAATGVSFTRILGQQHFPSDVLVGSAAGFLVGRYVVHHHRHWHNPISR